MKIFKFSNFSNLLSSSAPCLIPSPAAPFSLSHTSYRWRRDDIWNHVFRSLNACPSYTQCETVCFWPLHCVLSTAFAWRCCAIVEGRGYSDKSVLFYPMPLYGPHSSSLGRACSSEFSALLCGFGHRGLNPSDVECISSRVISHDICLGSMSLRASGSSPNGSQPIAWVTFVKRSPLMVQEPLKLYLGEVFRSNLISTYRLLRVQAHLVRHTPWILFTD